MKKGFFSRYASALTINKGASENKRDTKWYEKSVPCRSAALRKKEVMVEIQ